MQQIADVGETRQLRHEETFADLVHYEAVPASAAPMHFDDGQKVGMAPHFFNDICQEGSFSDATVLSLRVAPRGPVTSALCAR